ncbi:hypothetical protein [Caloramator mitchellensis]|nr:hypothetical protein [Caloramator mitchellensis]
MEIKCPTCGYLAKDTTVCPRCKTTILSCFNCSGNCLKCSKLKSNEK